MVKFSTEAYRGTVHTLPYTFSSEIFKLAVVGLRVSASIFLQILHLTQHLRLDKRRSSARRNLRYFFLFLGLMKY